MMSPRALIALASLWFPPRVPRSTIPPACVQEKAWLEKLPGRVLLPATWPLAFTPTALLKSPPRVPRSTIPPACVQEKAWNPEPGAVLLAPTTWPLAVTSTAVLKGPPMVPRSTIPPARVHEKACASPAAVSAPPTTWPLGLTAAARLSEPPSVPRSIGITVGPAARARPVEAPPAPVRSAARTTAPKIRIELNSLPLCLGVPERRVDRGQVCGAAHPDDVASSVDVGGHAHGVAGRGSELDHPAGPRPGEAAVRQDARRAADTDDLAARVHAAGAAVQAAEGAEVDHPACLGPRERVHRGIARGRAPADYFPARIHACGEGAGAAEGAEVDHPARLCPGEGVVLTGGGLAVADHLAACVDVDERARPAAQGAR